MSWNYYKIGETFKRRVSWVSKYDNLITASLFDNTHSSSLHANLGLLHKKWDYKYVCVFVSLYIHIDTLKQQKKKTHIHKMLTT